MAKKKTVGKLTKNTKSAKKEIKTTQTQPQIEYEYTDEENVIGFDDCPPQDMDFDEAMALYFEMENDWFGYFTAADAMEFACTVTSKFKRGSIPLDIRRSALNPWEYDRHIANLMN